MFFPLDKIKRVSYFVCSIVVIPCKSERVRILMLGGNKVGFYSLYFVAGGQY